jgi:hypothetical protein
MNESSKSSKLRGRVNCMTVSIIGVLIQDDDGRSSVSVNKTSSSGQWKVLDETLPYSGDIGFVKSRFREDFHVIASHATIGAAINQGAGDWCGCMIGELVRHRGSTDATIEVSIKRDKIILSFGMTIIGCCRGRSLIRSENLAK